MPTPSRKSIFLVLLAIFLVVAVAVIPDIISEEMRAWCLSTFGEGYQEYLLGFFVVGSVVLLFLTTDIGQHLRPGAANLGPDRSPGTPDPEFIVRIRKYLTERYEHRLSQKLAGRQPVNLCILPSKTGTSKEGAENYITLQEEEVRAAIGDIFTRANGRLLLVGLPGSGKTTLVLQLAMHLLERSGSSMPVVLNLATWRAEFKTFKEWLRKILPTELGASIGLAEQIQKHTPLILLLDGLDEVPEADRASLLAGIGEYGADANRQFLISSRIAEYAATKDAPVNAQVEVAPLTVEQVEIGLTATANIQPESRRLLNALKSDPLLREAVENPFYLNTAQLLFSTGKTWSEFGFAATDVAGRQRELVERFVEGALGRKVKEEYPAEKAGHWLSFLASRMTERNMVVFELRDLQYGWWRWPKKYFDMTYLLGLCYLILVILIPFKLYSEKIEPKWPFLVMYSMIIFSSWFLFYSNNKLKREVQYPVIKTVDAISWSWKYFLDSIIKKLGDGFLVGGFLGSLGGLILAWTGYIITGVIFGLIVCISVGIFITLSLVLIDIYKIRQFSIDQIKSPYHRFINSASYLSFSIFEHWRLRIKIHRKNLLPLRLVTFLNELSARHILETDGATWRFRHRILQDYFTAKYFVDNASKGVLEELLEEHLHDDTWDNVFIFIAGMLPDAEKLLFLMLKKNRELLQEPVLNTIVQKATNSRINYNIEVRKSPAIFTIHTHGNKNELDLDRDIANDRINKIALLWAFTLAKFLTHSDGFISNPAIDLAINLGRDLASDKYTLALEDSKRLSTYLQGNVLITQCLSAAYLSEDTCEYVLNRMLAPGNEE